MKRALNSITETAAVTWGRDGIRVNGLTPGGTATEMIDAWEAVPPGIIERINAATPLGRTAEPRELAAWLLSDRAGRRRRRRRHQRLTGRAAHPFAGTAITPDRRAGGRRCSAWSDDASNAVPQQGTPLFVQVRRLRCGGCVHIAHR
ncbi:SDR family oxidoreductase [Streptomyces sp. NBC_01378]|uniref:SDR family oxidoreductase n=1 Tax=Streptomyces sp. NBC_01378 TaxID=2903844 RepID=UPI00324303B9